LDEDKRARYGEKSFEITSRGIALETIREKGLFAAPGPQVASVKR
jgi:hypothetical protein